LATEWKTSATLPAFSLGHRLEAKCFLIQFHFIRACGGEAIQILPVRGLLCPARKGKTSCKGRMSVAVIKGDFQRVMAYRLQRGDADMALAGLQYFLPAPCPRTSAEGEYTRKYSAGSWKRAPSS
jgi:hypothetical protein